jgi:hypothetical protein
VLSSAGNEAWLLSEFFSERNASSEVESIALVEVLRIGIKYPELKCSKDYEELDQMINRASHTPHLACGGLFMTAIDITISV